MIYKYNENPMHEFLKYASLCWLSLFSEYRNPFHKKNHKIYYLWFWEHRWRPWIKRRKTDIFWQIVVMLHPFGNPLLWGSRCTRVTALWYPSGAVLFVTSTVIQCVICISVCTCFILNVWDFIVTGSLFCHLCFCISCKILQHSTMPVSKKNLKNNLSVS